MPSYLDDAGDAVRKVIRAYHGSPYDFNRFDASKIGTGEGTAQGIGHYFSSDQSVPLLYGKHRLEVDIDLPEQSLARWYEPVRDQGDMLDRFYAALSEAPENKWKGSAFAELMRRDGEAGAVYENLLRAHNAAEATGSQPMSLLARNALVRGGRIEAGKVASEALRRHGVFGGVWDASSEGAKNYVIFPGSEDAIRILRKYGMLAPIPAAAAVAQGEPQ